MERIADNTTTLCPPSNGLTTHAPYSSGLGEVASGALGTWSYQNKDNQEDDACQPLETGRHPDDINYQQAAQAFRNLLSGNEHRGRQLSLQDMITTDDPCILMQMINNVVQNSSDNKIKSLCKQIDTSSKITSLQLDRRVHEYQDQLQKSIDQADKARKAGFFGALFDWVIAAVEAVVGVLKIIEGVVTENPLDITDGVAYLGAGATGMAKAAAETAELFGADKAECDKVIDVAGKVQMGFESVAIALDVCKIGMGIREARVVGQAVEKVLDAGVGVGLKKALTEGSEEVIKDMLESIAKETSENVTKKFGASLEREMANIEEMSTEASEHIEQANALQVKTLGKKLSQDGVRELTAKALNKVLKKLPDLTVKEMRKKILQQVRKELVKVIIKDTINESLQTVRSGTDSVNKVTQGISQLQRAKLQREINDLASRMSFSDFMVQWLNLRINQAEKFLGEAYKIKADAYSATSEMINNYGTTLSRVVGMKA